MTAAVTLWLAPDDWGAPATWLPALAAHVRARPADAPEVLAVDVRTPGALDVLALACDHLSEGRAFAEVLAVTEDAEAARFAATCAPAPVPRDLRDLPADPDAAIALLRHAKGLHDLLRDHLAAAVFAAAPPPALDGRPLVTVRIPTWRGHEVLCSRTLPSVLQGGYEHVEVLVCSDGPDPEARRAVEEIARRDPRVRYLELPARPAYPEHPQSIWRVGGAHAVNATLAAARGEVIAPLDHDDAFTHGHVADLLTALARSGADLVYGQALCELREGPWVIGGSAPLSYGNVQHGAVMHTRRLAHVGIDPDCWILPEPGDWNSWRRMQAAGAQVAFLERPVLVHFAERSSMGDAADRARYVEPTAAEALADAARTPGLAALLPVAALLAAPAAVGAGS